MYVHASKYMCFIHLMFKSIIQYIYLLRIFIVIFGKLQNLLVSGIAIEEAHDI